MSPLSVLLRVRSVLGAVRMECEALVELAELASMTPAFPSYETRFEALTHTED